MIRATKAIILVYWHHVKLYRVIQNCLNFFRHYLSGGAPFLGGCKLHGTSLDAPDPDDDDEKQHFHELSPTLDSPLPTASPVRSPLANGSPRLTSRGHTPTFDHSRCSSTMHKSCVCVNFIAEHTRAKEDATKVSG